MKHCGKGENMKKFHFRLQKILEINEHQKQEAIKTLQDNINRHRICETELKAIKDYCNNLILEIKNLTAGSLFLFRLTMLKDYLYFQRGQQQEKAAELKQIKKEVEAARQNLITINRKNRMLKKLQEKAWEQYRQESLRFEQIEIDEIAGIGYYLKNKN